jgi:hypothetical protein
MGGGGRYEACTLFDRHGQQDRTGHDGQRGKPSSRIRSPAPADQRHEVDEGGDQTEFQEQDSGQDKLVTMKVRQW